jgi:Domain of unknown function (DUF222)/HNH endonuclease
MCEPGHGPGTFTGTAEALAAARASLGYLARADAACLPAGELADCLRDLEGIESLHTAARAGVLGAFTAQAGCQDDGHGSARAWLMGQTRVTEAAAGASVAWMRRLAGHPLVHEALAAEQIPSSAAREVCRLTRKLPPEVQADADQILLAAWAGGATLADLWGLAEEMRRRCGPPDKDPGRGFADRGVQLDITFGGAGKLVADLTPECAATISAMLASMSGPAGPADDRTVAQRQHDALEEACGRVIAVGGLPDVAGQPVQVLLHATLDQLRGLDGARDLEAAFRAGRAAGDGEPGWLSSSAAARGYACDAQMMPVVTGHVDPAVLAEMTRGYLAGLTRPRCTCGRCICPGGPGGPLGALSPGTLRRLEDTLLRYAAEVLSGPAGLASFLRTGLLAAEFPPSVSLPLDVGASIHTVPPHLRRACRIRDRHCAVGGCRQKASRCHVHHIKPRSEGGATSLDNLILLCPFHHLIAIHRWGWTIALNGDGTTTFTSPDGRRTFRSHGPPAAVAP